MPPIKINKYTYDTDNMLGEGTFSKVYKAFDTTLNEEVALKFYKGGYDEKYGVIEEVKRMRRMSHPCLVNYFDAFINNENNQQVGVIEYANGSEIAFNDYSKNYDIIDHCRKHQLNLPENFEKLKKLLKQVLSGLAHLHKLNIVHRDLKPHNILMHYQNGEWYAKIADFGISKTLEESSSGATQNIGTAEYAAPEQYYPKKFGIKQTISFNADLWAFGAIIYEIFTANLPCGRRSGGSSMAEIMGSLFTFEPKNLEWHKIPQPFLNVVKSCLVANANNRIQTASEVETLLANKTLSETTTIDPSLYENKETIQQTERNHNTRSESKNILQENLIIKFLNLSEENNHFKTIFTLLLPISLLMLFLGTSPIAGIFILISLIGYLVLSILSKSPLSTFKAVAILTLLLILLPVGVVQGFIASAFTGGISSLITFIKNLITQKQNNNAQQQ